MQLKTLTTDKMKIISLFFTILFIYTNCGNKNSVTTNYSQKKDTLLVLSALETDSVISNIILKLTVHNKTKDTLIFLPNPFVIESNLLNKNQTWVLSSKNFSTPNILYVYKLQNKIRFDSDGEYKPVFTEIPQINLLFPQDSIIMKINLPIEIVDQIPIKELKFFGALVYGVKHEADILSQNLDLKLLNLYRNNLTAEALNTINPVKLVQLETLLNGDPSDTVSNFIGNIFNKKLKF